MGSSGTLPYFDELRVVLAEIERRSAGAIRTAGEWVAEAVGQDHLVWVFGSGHAGIVTDESFYRAGGPACVGPIHLPGLLTTDRPITVTTENERRDGYAAERMAEVPVSVGDVLIVHSVSGRNPAPVEVAVEGKRRSARTIGILSAEWASTLTPRSITGKRLQDVVDLVIDNCVPAGDACVRLEGMAVRCCPLSSAVGIAILHSIFAAAWQVLVARGIEPPVFRSANEEGGDEWNRALLDRYRGRFGHL